MTLEDIDNLINIFNLVRVMDQYNIYIIKPVLFGIRIEFADISAIGTLLLTYICLFQAQNLTIDLQNVVQGRRYGSHWKQLIDLPLIQALQKFY